MSVSYTKKQRELAKTNGKNLTTVDVAGVCYQGFTDDATAKRLLDWLIENVFKKKP